MIEAQSTVACAGRVIGDQGLAMARCSAPSLPDAGPEPCGDAFSLVADVRLDNREELAAALNLSRSRLNQLSDASLLFQCLVAWGESTVDKLVGSFAFAFWDRRSGALLLARDYIGSCPLHYSKGYGYFAFASMPRGLHALGEVKRTPSTSAAWRSLMELPQPPLGTFFENVAQVAPGHLLRVRNGWCEHRRWWNFGADHPASRRTPSREECAEQARALLDQAVAAQLRGAEGLVATHLSAGLDSSAVTATAARALLGTGGRVLAYTAVPQPTHRENCARSIPNEGSLAGLVASQYPNIEQIEVENGGSVLEVFERNVRLWERPVPNPIHDLWWSRISEAAAARKARVVLIGAMGNLGLSHSGHENFFELLASRQYLRLAKAVSSARKVGGWSLGRLARTTFGPALPAPLASVVSAACSRPPASLFLCKDFERGGASTYGRPPRNALQRRLAVLGSTDPGVFFTGASYGWGVELRDPTADKRLMEFTLQLPTDIFFHEGADRALAKHALADRLPSELLTEHRRGLQSADWLQILRQNVDELVAEAEAIAASSAAEVVNATKILRAVHNLASKADLRPNSSDFHHALICALGVGHFLRS